MLKVHDLANHRLVFVGDGLVRFRYKDYGTGGAPKVMELTANTTLSESVNLR
jgi:hypothetical protein